MVKAWTRIILRTTYASGEAINVVRSVPKGAHIHANIIDLQRGQNPYGTTTAYISFFAIKPVHSRCAMSVWVVMLLNAV